MSEKSIEKELVRVTPSIKQRVAKFVIGKKNMTIGKFYDDAAKEKLQREQSKS